MTWDHNKDLHLALRAFRAEAHQIASKVDKLIKWMDKAIAEWEHAERAGGTDGEVRRAVNPFPSGCVGSNPTLPTSPSLPSQADPNAQARPAESQSGDGD
jgi:hypothetical protein